MDREILELLHDKLTATLMAKLESGEITASELSVVRQFLNDNNISLVTGQLENMHNTVPKLPTFDDLKIQ
jgi:hypothetical protein